MLTASGTGGILVGEDFYGEIIVKVAVNGQMS